MAAGHDGARRAVPTCLTCPTNSSPWPTRRWHGRHRCWSPTTPRLGHAFLAAMIRCRSLYCHLGLDRSQFAWFSDGEHQPAVDQAGNLHILIVERGYSALPSTRAFSLVDGRSTTSPAIDRNSPAETSALVWRASMHHRSNSPDTASGVERPFADGGPPSQLIPARIIVQTKVRPGHRSRIPLFNCRPFGQLEGHVRHAHRPSLPARVLF
jgi:hypothetical protein